MSFFGTNKDQGANQGTLAVVATSDPTLTCESTEVVRLEETVARSTRDLMEAFHQVQKILGSHGYSSTQDATSSALLQTVFQDAPWGIAVTSSDGVIQCHNKKFAEYFGDVATPKQHRRVADLFAPSHTAELEGYFRAADHSWREPIDQRDLTLDGRREDGKLFSCQLTLRRTGQAKEDQVVVYARLLQSPEHATSETRTLDAPQDIGQLAAAIARDINTPIQYLGDNVRFLRDAFQQMTSALAHYYEFLLAMKRISRNTKVVADFELKLQEFEFAYLAEEVPSAIEESLDGVKRVCSVVAAMKQMALSGCDDQTERDHPVEAEAEAEARHLLPGECQSTNDAEIGDCEEGK